MMRIRTWQVCLAVLINSSATALSGAQIVGSKHDFSTLGWAQGEICLPCHTPHRSDTSAEPPLWNHDLTSAEYVLYDSQWMREDVAQPGEGSTVCLSCHDGTVAINAFGGNGGSIFIEGDSLIGIGLSDDHPVGVEWTHQNTNADCSNCHNPYDPSWSPPVPLYNRRVECMTCHEPHNGGQGDSYMLRVRIAKSELCFICHGK